MRTKFSGFLTLLLVFIVQLGFAQEKTITGTVTDPDGLPLPGATVQIKNTGSGTQTGFDGNFSIKASVDDVLIFSYVGMKTQEIKVGSQSSISISLQIDAAELDAVIVEGYRTGIKETSNISAVTVSAETIEARPNASFIQTLQGQVAGLNITTSSGQPGANSTINLRGVGSVNGNTEPLVIMDGVPVDDDNFRSLNPNDIESISVLKDAGATSIYGNRGANGVIVITTKKGSYGSKLKVNYLGTTGFVSLQNHHYDLMNSYDELMLEHDYGSGLGASLSLAEIDIRAAQTNTEWLDYFFDSGTMQNHTLSLSGGGENMSAFTSVGFYQQDGLLKGASGLQRFNFRNNINGKSANGKFTYGTTLTANYSKNSEPTSIGTGGVNRNLVLGAVGGMPYISPYSYIPGEGGNIPVNFANTALFLMDLLETHTRKEEELKMIASINASYEITKNLTFKTTLGSDFTEEWFLRAEAPNSFNALLFAETGNTTPGFSDQASTRSVRINFNNSLTYRNTFAEKHTVEVSAFTEYFKAHYRSFGFRQNGYDPATYYPGDGAAFIDDNSQNDFFTDQANATIRNAGLFSYFGYVDYDYDRTYGFSATIRRDASYRFSDSNKWGTFWSVAARWNISNEKFMSGSFANLLKLRGSYGTAGNQDISAVAGQFAPFNAPDLTRNLFATSGQYEGINGYTVGQLGNNALKWETIKQANIALDFGLWNNTVTGTVEYYKKNTEDLYLSTPISPALNGGIASISANAGELQNSGVDVELHYNVIKAKQAEDLNVRLNFTGNYNKQEFKNLGAGGDVPYTYRVGGPLAEIYAAPYVGVNPANGNLLFEDINGNITEDIDAVDQRATGKNIYPDYVGSFGFEIDYKNFFFITQWNYTIGTWRYDFDYEGYIDPTSIGQFRHSNDIKRAWTQPGDITDIPSLNANNLTDDDFSDRFLVDSDYLRLRYVQVGYNFPSSVLDHIGLSTARIFANAENLVTFTKWKGFDAESLNSANQYDYPSPKIVSFGVELGF